MLALWVLKQMCVTRLLQQGLFSQINECRPLINNSTHWNSKRRLHKSKQRNRENGTEILGNIVAPVWH